MQEPARFTHRSFPLVTVFVRSLLVLVLSTAPAWGFTMVTVDAGSGSGDARLLRLNLSIGERWRQQATASWYWSRAWEGNVSHWYLYRKTKGNETLVEVGLTPNFRLEREQRWDWGRPFLELGVGLHLLSKSHIGERDMSSAFQFGSHAGGGVRFGPRERYELAWRFEHLSNAGLRSPNPGIDFSMLRLGYRW